MDIIASTGNLYLDSSRTPNNSSSTGDNFQVDLGALTLQADENQKLRLTLLEFNMYKTFTDVNENNNKFVFNNATPATVGGGALTKQNYATLSDLAQDFANQVGGILVPLTAGATTFVVSALKPAATTSIMGTTDNIISFTITPVNGAAVPQPITITAPQIQSLEAKGDFFALIGGDRVSSFNPTASTVSCVLNGAVSLTVQCLYPAQRSTTPYIYIRTSLETASLETSSLDRPSGQDTIQAVLGTNILGRVAVNTEFCNYSAQMPETFYIDIKQKSVSTLRLYLTDESNRPIGRRYGSSERTASGTGTNQSNLGNLTFSAVCRIDVIQVRPPHDRLFPEKPITINSKLSNMTIRPTPPL